MIDADIPAAAISQHVENTGACAEVQSVRWTQRKAGHRWMPRLANCFKSKPNASGYSVMSRVLARTLGRDDRDDAQSERGRLGAERCARASDALRQGGSVFLQEAVWS